MDCQNLAGVANCQIYSFKLAKGISLPPKDTQKCVLKIPDKHRTDKVLDGISLQLPVLQKSKSAANTPLRLCSRILKNKDYEFPEILKKTYKFVISGETEINENHSPMRKELDLPLLRVKQQENYLGHELFHRRGLNILYK